MRKLVKRSLTILAISLAAVLNPCSSAMMSGLTAESLTPGNSARKGRAPQAAPAPEPAAPEARNRGGMGTGDLEKEAAAGMKEQELKKLDANIDNKIRKLDETRKSMETTLSQKKKADSERYQKMVKLYKALRPEEAAKLIDKMDEGMAMELMNHLDQKTMAKLIPLMNQNRVLKWTRLSLKGE